MVNEVLNRALIPGKLPRSAQRERSLWVYKASVDLAPRDLHSGQTPQEPAPVAFPYRKPPLVPSAGCCYWESTQIETERLFPYILVTVASDKTSVLLTSP